MDVDVTYEGLILMRGAALTTTPNGPFIGLNAPMPVGTNLVLQREGASCSVRVARVEEGASAGIFIAPLESLDRLMPGAGSEFAPPAPPPAAAMVMAEAEAPAVAPVVAETAELPPASGLNGLGARAAKEVLQDAAGRTETVPPDDEVTAPPVAEARAADDASPSAPPAAAAPETAPVPEVATPPETAAVEPTAAPPEAIEPEAAAETVVPEAIEAIEVASPEAPPANDAPSMPEAASGAVAQEMDPRLVTAPVAAADILEEMPATNTGPVQAPKKGATARDSDGDASKKARRRGGSRGGKKR